MARKRFKNPSNGINLVLPGLGPETEWTPPTEFPNLSGIGRLGLDIETCDPRLTTHGPGAQREEGFITGISVACLPCDRYPKGGKWYFPVAHQAGGNLNPDDVFTWLKTLDKPIEWVGANFGYDLEWLDSYGVCLKGKMIDVQVAEALIDEESPSFSLNALCNKYLARGKTEDLLKAAADAYGVDPKKEMWKLPSYYVGPYAEADAMDVLEIYEKQTVIHQQEKLTKVFNLECEVLPLLVKMRKLGVRVDVVKAKASSSIWGDQIKSLQKSLDNEHNMHINVNSPKDLEKVAIMAGITYPKTEKGNPSFDKNFLKRSTNGSMKTIAKIRNMKKLKADFVDKLIIGHSHRGRIYSVFNQTARDDSDGARIGTATGRFSCTKPNLQQVPSRDPILAPIIRGFFIADAKKKWAKLDYSQQEPRILVHYANLMGFEGAADAAEAYRNDKSMDYYQYVADKAGLERKPAKDLTLGIFYGEGKRKIAIDLGMSVEEAMALRAGFEKTNPYVKDIYEEAMKIAKKRGYITTILGRHRHFWMWEPVDTWAMRDEGKDVMAVRLDEAKKKWPDHKLQRAYAYKALNAVIQGSAADMTKAAMLKVYNEMGLIPHMQVHDELNYSVESEGQAQEIKHWMENCCDLTVPMLADLDYGDTWK